MQETRYPADDEMFKHFQEVFMAPTHSELISTMDARLEELKAKGHELVRRVELDEPAVKSISRNALCPCGSGHKYKRCCAKVR